MRVFEANDSFQQSQTWIFHGDIAAKSVFFLYAHHGDFPQPS